MKAYHFFALLLMLWYACGQRPTSDFAMQENVSRDLDLTLSEAERLVQLPLHCIDQEYPYKLGQTLGDSADLATPKQLHPAFYGCFDWHSAVHGHWSLIALLKRYPSLQQATLIKDKLLEHLSAKNIQAEIEYFNSHHNRNFERTYGWAWLLKLALELRDWQDPVAAKLSANLRPLCDLLIEKYAGYLPRLVYPIRVGTHANTAFGLTFAYDYAKALHIDSLARIIEDRCEGYYGNDHSCPIDWEPSGADFLSPCLEEINMMQRILTPEHFLVWLRNFMPALFEPDFNLDPGRVIDREDGQLVHLDGVNFSRAWCFYDLANGFDELRHLRTVGDNHMSASLPNLVGDSYEGSHWLASFAILALASR